MRVTVSFATTPLNLDIRTAGTETIRSSWMYRMPTAFGKKYMCGHQESLTGMSITPAREAVFATSDMQCAMSAYTAEPRPQRMDVIQALLECRSGDFW